ncbi:MAG: DUF5606 domain-containing protein [Bacteroidales bacterium]|nr:DUF5606 domain-containing protein [Bacteroidales bacterium]
MQLSNILVISGKPDLNELLSRTRGGAVVKNIMTGQKFTVFSNDRISSLSEIRIYVNSGETPLEDVLRNIRDKQERQPLAFDPKKADNKQLFDYFAEVQPDYDTERVHASDIKKVLHWYNILLAAGKLEDEPEQEENSSETPKAE